MPKDATNKPPAKKAATKAATSQAAPAKAASVRSSSPTPTKKAAEKSASQPSAPAPTHQQIAEHAHHLWSQRGSHHGGHVNDWLNAEEQLKAGK